MLALFGLGSILAALVIGPARRRWGTETVLMVATGGFVAAQIAAGTRHEISGLACHFRRRRGLGAGADHASMSPCNCVRPMPFSDAACRSTRP